MTATEQPMTADAWNDLGTRLYFNASWGHAEDAFRECLRLDPRHAKAISNLGLVYFNNGFVVEAEEHYQMSLALDATNVDPWINMGHLREEQGRTDDAMDYFRRALAIDPKAYRATSNLAISHLKKFQFAEGWAYSEARFKTFPPVAKMRDFGRLPLWDGRPCERVLLWPEQGLGDSILYTSLLPDLVARGQAFDLEVDPRLVEVYRRSFPGVDVVGTIPAGSGVVLDCNKRTAFDVAPYCDAHLPLGSLPALLRPSLESFRGQTTGFLKSASVTETRKPSVGVAWRSFKPALLKQNQEAKSAPLESFRPIIGGGWNGYNLQYGDVPEWMQLVGHDDFPDLDRKNDIEGILSLIAGLDCVVTTSNVTAHFAGALGKRCILIYRNGVAPFFYWQPHNGRSLWYPSVRIISGPDLDTWEKCVAAAVEELRFDSDN